MGWRRQGCWKGGKEGESAGIEGEGGWRRDLGGWEGDGRVQRHAVATQASLCQLFARCSNNPISPLSLCPSAFSMPFLASFIIYILYFCFSHLSRTNTWNVTWATYGTWQESTWEHHSPSLCVPVFVCVLSDDIHLCLTGAPIPADFAGIRFDWICQQQQPPSFIPPFFLSRSPGCSAHFLCACVLLLIRVFD